MKMFQLLFLFCISSLFSFSQSGRPTNEIMEEAFAKAAKENKNVFVKFSASWCGWCHKMDASMKAPSCKRFFDDNFVTVTLITGERSSNAHLNNPGADSLVLKYNDGEANPGLPFWFILSSTGKLLEDGFIHEDGKPFTKNGNQIGCPASKKEVEAFVKALKNTTRLDARQLQIIDNRFRRNEL